jgi:Protein of unknown function (DUF2911)
MRVSKSVPLAVLTLLMAACCACSQENRPSPPGTAEITLKDQTISIAYSRPSMRGRKVVGGELVPYGRVWRTGANEATKLSTPVALTIAGKAVPAGDYSLFTLPAESGWTLIINKQTGQSGLEYNQEQDLARVPMKVSKLPAPVEQFTISWNKKGASSADLVLEWENTRVSVPVEAK